MRQKISLAILVICCAVGLIMLNSLDKKAPLWMTLRMLGNNYHPIVLAPDTPALPVPNAFDTFYKAAGALRDKEAIETAYLYGNPGASLIRENAPTLALFHQGLSQPYLHPPIRTLDPTTAYYKQWHALAQLLALDARDRASRGDWAGMSQNALDTLQFGATIPHGANMVGGFVGIGVQKIGRATLWTCLDHLDARQARQAAHRLEQIDAEQICSADLLRQEMETCYAGCKALYIDQAPASAGQSAVQQAHQRRLNAILLDLYVRYMQRCIANARLPYVTATPAARRDGSLARNLAPDERKVVVEFLDNQARHELLTLSLALRAYQAEHAAFPPRSMRWRPPTSPTFPPIPSRRKVAIAINCGERATSSTVSVPIAKTMAAYHSTTPRARMANPAA